MPHTHHSASESISFSVALICLALIYLCGWFRIRRMRLDRMEGWRAASFLSGLFLIWISVASPLAALDHELLTAHMIHHLLLMTFAAPLIWLGTPGKLLLQGLPKRVVQSVIIPLGRCAQVKKVGNALAHPAVCWLAATATLIAWHIPSVFMLALHSAMWHGFEDASFLVAGLLFWWPVIGPWSMGLRRPEWSILLYLFFATLPCDILSGFLVFCDRVMYPVYMCSSRPFGLSPLQDQECAAALMWTCVTVVYLIPGTVIAARLLSPNSPRQPWVLPDSQATTVPRPAERSMEVV